MIAIERADATDTSGSLPRWEWVQPEKVKLGWLIAIGHGDNMHTQFVADTIADQHGRTLLFRDGNSVRYDWDEKVLATPEASRFAEIHGLS